MTTMRIVFECDDTPGNRRMAALLFDNVRERMANPDYADGLPVTRSLDDPYEMSKVIDCITVTGMRIETGPGYEPGMPHEDEEAP